MWTIVAPTTNHFRVLEFIYFYVKLRICFYLFFGHSDHYSHLAVLFAFSFRLSVVKWFIRHKSGIQVKGHYRYPKHAGNRQRCNNFVHRHFIKKVFFIKLCKYYKEIQSLHLLSTVRPPEVSDCSNIMVYRLHVPGNVLIVQKTLKLIINKFV